MQRLRIHGAIPPLPPHASMATVLGKIDQAPFTAYFRSGHCLSFMCYHNVYINTRPLSENQPQRRDSIQNQGLCSYYSAFYCCLYRRSRHGKSKRSDKVTVLARTLKRTTLYIQRNIYVTHPKKTRQDALANGVLQQLNGVTRARHQAEQLNADLTRE